jgi:hypothetical protein
LKDTSNQKPPTEEGQTKERAKDKGEKDKQRSTKHCTEN